MLAFRNARISARFALPHMASLRPGRVVLLGKCILLSWLVLMRQEITLIVFAFASSRK